MPGIEIPEPCLVALVGVSGSGKSSLATRHFARTEVLSSDFCRGLVADDENDQSATEAAFEVLHFIAGKRLAAGRLAVVDAGSNLGASIPHCPNQVASRPGPSGGQDTNGDPQILGDLGNRGSPLTDPNCQHVLPGLQQDVPRASYRLNPCFNQAGAMVTHQRKPPPH